VIASSGVASMSCGREWGTGGLGGSFNVLAAMKNGDGFLLDFVG